MSILQRLQRLESLLGQRNGHLTVFWLEDGSPFYSDDDPFSYLMKHGTETARGKIARFERPPGAADPISEALYQEIDRMIREGVTPL